MKRRIKHWVGLLLAWSGLYRRLLRGHALVVLFHRVDPRLGGNPISCTPDEFRDWCGFLRRYFEVVSLSTLVEKLQNGDRIDLHAVITFDDGYLDNFTFAAPELEQQGLPACFYVATEFLESDHVPFWDDDLPFRPEWMSWENVRSLAQRGFEVGSHTLHHVDLARVDANTAEREISESRDRLTRELGTPVRHFSYPFGGRDNFNEARRETVRREGYESCVSAYGGLVGQNDDVFRIERIPISPWFVSPYHFLTDMVREVRGGRHR